MSKTVSHLQSFDPKKESFNEMTVMVNGEVRRVHIGAHSYMDEDDAVYAIREIYRSGKVPFILPVKL